MDSSLQVDESGSGVKVEEEERLTLLREQQAYDREEMNVDRIVLTRNKILELWQSLE